MARARWLATVRLRPSAGAVTTATTDNGACIKVVPVPHRTRRNGGHEVRSRSDVPSRAPHRGWSQPQQSELDLPHRPLTCKAHALRIRRASGYFNGSRPHRGRRRTRERRGARPPHWSAWRLAFWIWSRQRAGPDRYLSGVFELASAGSTVLALEPGHHGQAEQEQQPDREQRA